MKKFSQIVTCAILFASMAACEQKITQQVVLDPALLETLKGKGTDTKTPSGSPSNIPSARPSSIEASTLPLEDSSTLQVIRMNAEALNSQNFIAYRSTFHPDSIFMQAIEAIYQQLVLADTSYEIQNIKQQSQDTNFATVVATIDITDFGGTIQNTLEYTLKKSGSEWKIFSAKILNSTTMFAENDDF